MMDSSAVLDNISWTTLSDIWAKNFEMTTGTVDNFIGIKITRNRLMRTIYFTQESYILKTLRNSKWTDATAVLFLMTHLFIWPKILKMKMMKNSHTVKQSDTWFLPSRVPALTLLMLSTNWHNFQTNRLELTEKRLNIYFAYLKSTADHGTMLRGKGYGGTT